MPKKETFTIPDLSAILKESREICAAWCDTKEAKIINNPNAKPVYQDVCPQDTHLAQKLGIRQNDHLFVFAGYYGDWAYALSQNCSVTYSDISKEIVSYVVKKKYPNLMKRFCVADGALLPLSKNIDWLFSFDPIPLAGVQLPLVLLQGMSRCSKGVIIASGLLIGMPNPMSKTAALYGAKYKEDTISTQLSSEESNIYVCKIVTNYTAKARATLDLKVILHLQKKTARITKIFEKTYPASFFGGVPDVITADKIAEIGALLGKNNDEIIESLRRITNFSEFIIKDCIKKCTFVES